MITEELQRLYREYTRVPAENIIESPSPGSNRRYFRPADTEAPIGACDTSVKENNAFLYIIAHFRKSGLPVFEVHIASENESCYLQEGLGNTLLFHAAGKGRATSVFSGEEKELLRKTVRLLPAMQFAGAGDFGFSRCYPQPGFNQRPILWDLNYFEYYFPKTTGMKFQEDRLEDNFQEMNDVLLRSSSATFTYRGFQSRDVIIKDDKPWFIDFQGGRKGPFYYDVAPFLWQARAKYPDSLHQELLKEYIDTLCKYQPIDRPYFYSQPRYSVLFYTLQMLGVYSFRGYFEKKPHFIQGVSFAIQNLRDLLKKAYPEYPYLCNVLHELTKFKQFTNNLKEWQLTIRVTSFIYKKETPGDPIGNGDGYVSDCRAVNNPGRYERYKPLAGLDEPVTSFLEEDSEVLRFLDSVYALVSVSVKRYMERGFSNLSVCFSCTEGQRRSVYSAQHLAEHPNRKFGVKVELVHREQNIERTFEVTV